MTARELAARARPLLARWWPALLAGAVVLLLVVAWNRARRDRDALATYLEEERARAAGLLVVEQARAGALDELVRRLTGENEDLGAELARARAALPGSRPVGAARATTGPRPSGGDPRPADPAAPAGSAAASPACLLSAGDSGEVRIDQVLLEGRAGARVLVGAASAWRTEPAPKTLLFGGPFQAPLSEARGEELARAPGWGAGVWVGVGREGWAVGPAAAFPPARLGPVQLEVVAGGGLGPGGEWQGGASGVARW